MRTVQPIRDIEKLQKCYQIADEHDRNKQGDAISWKLLLLIGFNTSLRISDVRRFKVKDIRGKDYAQIDAKKTGKEARILMNRWARKEIDTLLACRDPDEYIFQSRISDADTHNPRPVTRQRCYQIINSIARQAGIEERIGCHNQEANPEHGISGNEAEYCGCVYSSARPDKLFEIYRYGEDGFFYKTKIVKNGIRLPKFDAIFGYPEREQWERRKKRYEARWPDKDEGVSDGQPAD